PLVVAVLVGAPVGSGAAAIADGAGAVTVQFFVVMRRNVAAGEILFNPLEELGVGGHQVFAFPMDGAFLHHPDLAIALNDLSLDLAYLLVNEVGPVLGAVDDGVASFLDAAGAERVGGARPAEGGLALLPRLQHGLVRPLRSERRIRPKPIEDLDGVESQPGRLAKGPVERLPDLVSNNVRHSPAPSPRTS